VPLVVFKVYFTESNVRRIFGPTKENQIWRVKTNEELRQADKT
jgi:hypothetical protein